MVENDSAGPVQAPDSVEESVLPGVCLVLATCAGCAVGFNFGSANHCGLRKGAEVLRQPSGKGNHSKHRGGKGHYRNYSVGKHVCQIQRIP